MDIVYETRKAGEKWEVVEFRVDDAGHKDRGEVVADFDDEEGANDYRDIRNRATLR